MGIPNTSNFSRLPHHAQVVKSHKLRALISWAFYDWANSAFAAIIQTFVFAAYFVNSVAINEVQGSAAWGTITGLSAFVVALISPVFGAIADQGGRRKHGLAYLL